MAITLDGSNGIKLPVLSTDPTGATEGFIYYNSADEEIRIKNGSGNFGKISAKTLGTQASPALSGIQLRDEGYPSGFYYLQPSGYSTSYYTYVNNDFQGGGWVLFHRVTRSNYDNIAFTSNRDMTNYTSAYSERFMAPWAFMNSIRSARTTGNIGRSEFLTYITNDINNTNDSHSDNNFAVVKPNTSGQDFADGSGGGVNDIPTYGKIRGYQIQDQISYWSSGSIYDTRWWYNSDSNYPPHFDTSSTGVPGSITSEDAFGYTTTNSSHWTGSQFLCWFIR